MDGRAEPAPMVGVRPAILGTPESRIVEIFNYGRARQGTIPLWVGEGDQPTARFICEAAEQSLRDGQTFYTYQRGIPPLRQALQARLDHETYQWVSRTVPVEVPDLGQGVDPFVGAQWHSGCLEPSSIPSDSDSSDPETRNEGWGPLKAHYRG